MGPPTPFNPRFFFIRSDVSRFCNGAGGYTIASPDCNNIVSSNGYTIAGPDGDIFVSADGYIIMGPYGYTIISSDGYIIGTIGIISRLSGCCWRCTHACRKCYSFKDTDTN